MIQTNKDLTPRLFPKQKITTAEGGRYTYYDYDKEIVEKIALTNVFSSEDADLTKLTYTLVQTLYPDYLICSGLFDSFCLFEVAHGKRVDPPVEAHARMDSNKGYLILQVKDLFDKNNLPYSDDWATLFAKEFV